MSEIIGTLASISRAVDGAVEGDIRDFLTLLRATSMCLLALMLLYEARVAYFPPNYSFTVRAKAKEGIRKAGLYFVLQATFILQMLKAW